MIRHFISAAMDFAWWGSLVHAPAQQRTGSSPLFRTTVRGLLWMATALGVFPLCSLGQDRQAHSASHWNQWRGPLGTGVAPNARPPIEWSRDKNIRWKTRLPGKGHSSPVLWDDHVFVTTAIPVGPKLPPRMSGRPGEHDNLPIDSKHQFVVIAIDRHQGTVLWKKVVREAVPLEAGHTTGSLATASPVTDGEFVYAYFGAQGLYCLDLRGKLVWEPASVRHADRKMGRCDRSALNLVPILNSDRGKPTSP